MKKIDWKVLSELIRNSRISDRDLARRIGISQATVSRMRRKLEQEGYIKEYTVIPDFVKLGYELLALTFVKLRKGLTKEEVEKARKIAQEDLVKGSSESIMMEREIGLGYEGVIVSFHTNYQSYINLRNRLKRYIFLDLSKIDSFIISLNDEVHYKPLTFSTLARHLLTLKERENKEEH